MTRLAMLAISGLLLVGCGAASTASPSTAPQPTALVSESPGSESTTPTSSMDAGSASATAGTAQRFFDCQPAGGELTCPLPPGHYVADIHDAFSLEIEDPGWQEARTNPEDLQGAEPTLTLSRVEDSNQRLMIDTGPSGASVSDDQLLPDLTSLQVGPPTAVEVGATAGLQVDLSPTESTDLSVPVAGGAGYQLEPGNTYRLIVTQLPMGDESAFKVVVISAPTADWSTFLPLADKVVQTLQFG